MEFWNKLSEALKQKGFSAQQIKKLEEMFGHLDAARLMRLSPDQLLPAMTGRTVAEKREKIETLQATVREVQASTDDRMPDRPRRGTDRVPFNIRLTERDAEHRPPLRHFRVRIEALSEHGEPDALLFRGRSDARGAITFTLPEPNDQVSPKQAKVTVLGVDGEAILEQNIHLDSGEPQVTIDAELSDYRRRVSVPLDEWQRVTGRRFSSTLNEWFDRERISSLADVRRVASGLLNKPELNQQDEQLLDEVIAHAQLQLLNQDTSTNKLLIAAGFKDIFSIATLSRRDFLARVSMNDQLVRRADEIHTRAVNKVEFLKNKALEVRIFQLNGSGQSNRSAEPQPCGCDCQSAVSPLAYLADLLDFVQREVSYNDGDFTLDQLGRFHQPLTALPADCSASEEIVRQVRICVEVLRSKALAEKKKDGADEKSAEHALRSYDALLGAMGTSSRELRLLRGASEEDQIRRAQSLGIDVEHIEDLLLDEPTEKALETLFGLQDTTRDPLSYGVKTGDNNDRIHRWQLKGTAWKRNTDKNGKIYGRLEGEEDKFIVTFYQTKSRRDANIIAQGEVSRGTASNRPRKLQLHAKNSSGLTGQFLIDRAADGTIDFELQAFPRLLVWQYEELNQRWHEEDQPYEPLYPEGLPLVDPDMLTEANFCRPLVQNSAYRFWTRRSRQLREKEREITPEDSSNGDNAYPIQEMLQAVWPENSDEISAPDWDNLADRLDSNETEAVKQAIAEVSELHLTFETFNFINELRQREIEEGELDAASSELTKSEEEERAKQQATALDIMINVVKRRDYYPVWADEEQGNRIVLTPAYFCSTNEETVAKRPQSVSQEQYSQWQQQLSQNSRAPIVDPDIVHPLPPLGPSGGPGQSLRQDRANQLRAIQEQLSDQLAGQTAQEKIHWLDAHLGTAQPQDEDEFAIHSLGLAEPQLLQQNFDNRELEIQPQQHGLLPKEVIALFTLRKLVVSELADSTDWKAILHILIQAEKRRYLYTQWLEEEKYHKLTLSPAFFYSPDHLLLKSLANDKRPAEEIEWRGGTSVLKNWRSKLTARYQQRAALVEGLRAVVDSAEEATLPALRDALIDLLYSDPNGAKREQHKKDAANSLLINTFESGCRKTTRVAQAIETMQLLVWGILNRQFEDTNFTIPDANEEAFEAAWYWLQSYATWRSAVFVYLYPENILLPSLYQSDSVVFNVVRRIISGELGPDDGEAADDDEDSSESSADLSALEKQIVDTVFWDFGNHLSPLSFKGVSFIVFHMLRYRLQDQSSYESYVDDDESTNPYVSTPDENVGFLFQPKYDNLLVFPFIWNWDNPVNWNNEQYEFEDTVLLPLHAALMFQQKGQFEDALEMYRWVYDFQKMDFRFDRVKELLADRQGTFSAYEDWLYQDRLDPHALAKTRTDVDLRFILISIIRCLLEYAEAEFSTDTAESLGRARELYFTAQRLLEHEALRQNQPDCKGRIGKLIKSFGGRYRELLSEVVKEADILNRPSLTDDLQIWIGITNRVEAIVRQHGPEPAPDQIRTQIIEVFDTYFPLSSTPDLETRLDNIAAQQTEHLQATLQHEETFEIAQNLDQGAMKLEPGMVAFNTFSRTRSQPLSASVGIGLLHPAKPSMYIPGVVFEFCIAPNPLLNGLRLRTEVGLYKLSNCMNLAGMRREVPLYAAPTDTSSGMPVIGTSGTLSLPGTVRLQSTQYRYKVLVERARQLVDSARQLESSYLSSLESFDRETYSVLNARHDLDISNTQVTLQGLRLTEAQNGIALAELQQERASIQEEHFIGLIDTDLLSTETWALNLLRLNLGLQFFVGALTTGGAIAAGLVAGGVIGSESGPGALITALAGGGTAAALSMSLSQTAYSSITQGIATTSSVMSMMASFERRRQDWELQKLLSEQDVLIGTQQVAIAEDRVRITGYELEIANIQANHADDVIHFLNNKFTSAELYHWMSRIVGEAYRYFLEQATAIAKMAQMQLAFERQEVGLDYILGDYWAVKGATAAFGSGEDSPDRRGMTGSVRLLQDITRMDQHAFTTDKRKLQLSKTISLAMHDPVSFYQFKTSGVLPFTTTHELFDRDFPGHYLRLIKRVRTTVIALVPLTQGIKATLSHTGISHAMVSTEGGVLFEDREVRRDPESVALTSPANDSGVFEMQEQPELLLPFEGLGLAGSWEFQMPRAANAFDFGTIADVLITIEYTALDSQTYRQQVIQQLDRSVSADRPFSFRHQFADAWYDLHHPDLVQNPQQPMAVSFSTRREDFPPNVTDLEIEHVTLYIARKSGTTDEFDLDLKLGSTGNIGGAARTVDGVASTRKGNAGVWAAAMIRKSPIGKWTLAFKDEEEVRDLFANDQIEDILFVITFGGKTPEWPQ